MFKLFYDYIVSEAFCDKEIISKFILMQISRMYSILCVCLCVCECACLQ